MPLRTEGVLRGIDATIGVVVLLRSVTMVLIFGCLLATGLLIFACLAAVFTAESLLLAHFLVGIAVFLK